MDELYRNALKKAHDANRYTMRKLDEICHKYNIRYFYDSGALLGAVRHKSSIPWDDDIDVAFTRDEYNKLLSLPADVWGEDFQLVKNCDLTSGTFFDFTHRLMNMKDKISLKTYEKCKTTIKKEYSDKLGVDLFILDNAYDNRFRQNMLRLHLVFIYGLAMGHRSQLDLNEYKGVKKIIVKILSWIGKGVSLDYLYRRYDEVSKSAKRKSNKFFYSNYPIEDTKIVVEKGWFRETVKVQVDNDEFDAPIDFDSVLRAQYGDYMQLPPEEKRIPAHINIGSV